MSLNKPTSKGLRISRDAFGVASSAVPVNAIVEDQPVVFACLAPLCQLPRQLDDPRGGEVTRRRAAEVCLDSGSCTCQQETSGGFPVIHLRKTSLSPSHQRSYVGLALFRYIGHRHRHDGPRLGAEETREFPPVLKSFV